MAAKTAEYLTPKEAAGVLGVSVQHLRHMSNLGQIKCKRTPLGRMFAIREVQRVAAAREGLPPRGRPSKARTQAAAA